MRNEGVNRQLVEIDRELMDSRIRAIFEHRKAGEMPAIMKFGAPDLVLSCNGWNGQPGRVEFHGVSECLRALHDMNMRYESVECAIHEILIDGEFAAVRRTSTFRHRGTGRQADVDICDFVRFSDGLVCSYELFPDTQALTYLERGPQLTTA